MSPFLPHVAVQLSFTYHVPLEGRNTAMSLLWSTLYSAGTGTSPLRPKCTEGRPLTYQVALDGRKTAVSLSWSPLRSSCVQCGTALRSALEPAPAFETAETKTP